MSLLWTLKTTVVLACLSCVSVAHDSPEKRCDVSAATMNIPPGVALPAPEFAPKFIGLGVGLGVGTQNYTCTSAGILTWEAFSQALPSLAYNSLFRNVGALAERYTTSPVCLAPRTLIISPPSRSTFGTTLGQLWFLPPSWNILEKNLALRSFWGNTTLLPILSPALGLTQNGILQILVILPHL